ncbi:hypothetical protein OCV73_02545 [Barnesiella propionica]|uniref:hypothetical protein n=1 Tax=Barnesiella propionica TaxID=2981781 RepID=UPI0021D3E714|nr:hypothetical protein [Barnesiella propionica]MCU6767837.1 hypothetical protein [Barnesiella propionica]
MRVYREQILHCDTIKLPQIFDLVVNTPSVRFWVSEERAAIVIANMMRGDKLLKMRNTKREMFFEIYKRAMKLRQEYPEMSVYELAFHVVRQPAPKFYLTAGSAKVIVHKIKKKWYEERKRKQRYLF